MVPSLPVLLFCFCLVLTDNVSAAVVFMYHRFGETGLPSTNVTLAQFSAHLEFLASHGYQVWPLPRIADHLKNHKPIPDRVVALTVDDAYASVYDQAYPLIKARQWPLTVFVSTDAIDHHLRGYMTWDQMRDMRDHNVTFANHSSTHSHLIERQGKETTAAWQQRVSADITHAQQRLEQELGPTPGLFAYPYGEYTPVLKQLLAELGYQAFGQQSGAIGPGSDLRLLPRFPMAERFAGMAQFSLKAAALPFPVTDIEPDNPVIDSNHLRPTLTLTVDARRLPRLEELACYLNGQKMTTIVWQGKDRFSVSADHNLTERRSRYNCTVPSQQDGRYHWYSQLWINPAVDEP